MNYKVRFMENMESARRYHAIPCAVFDKLIEIAERKQWLPQLLDVLEVDLEHAPDWWLESEVKNPTGYSFVTTRYYVVFQQELSRKAALCRKALAQRQQQLVEHGAGI